jgi:spore coat protein H
MKLKLTAFVFLFISIIGCRKNPVPDAIVDPVAYNPDWTTTTHGNVSPDYTTVFPQNAINTIEITIGATNWAAIRNNMKSLYGYDFGAGGAGAPGGFPATDPDYVDVTLKFNGKTWKNVGYRLKGNSTLSQSWRSGNYKLPFRFNFDKFEDQYPGIKNQHFYGFEELSFSPGAKDQSLIREKITADIFRLNGIAAPQTAFYKVFTDFGAGLKYCGVYCCVEVPEDNMVKSQLGEESGNMYKPESNFASFVQSKFEKKNNETAANYSDVQGFITALNSGLRTANPTLWRANMEAIFNVDYFTKWLATNTAIVNWDTYGSIAHNYYLYNHSINKLMWIPWDNNEALTRSPGITGTTGGGGAYALSLSMNEVNAAAWPLLRYIADDAVYMQKYKDYLKSFKNNVLTQTAMDALIDKYYTLVTPFAIGINGEQPGYTYLTGSTAFTNEKDILKTHISNRRSLITTYVP